MAVRVIRRSLISLSVIGISIELQLIVTSKVPVRIGETNSVRVIILLSTGLNIDTLSHERTADSFQHTDPNSRQTAGSAANSTNCHIKRSILPEVFPLILVC